MPLADDIQALRHRTLRDLVAAHAYSFEVEYYLGYLAGHSAGRLEGMASALGFDVTPPAPSPVVNLVTGTVTTVEEFFARAPGYTSGYLAEATFQQFLTIFEAFVGDFLRLWLTAYPRSLGSKPLTLADALDAGDVPGVVRRVVDLEVFEVTYKSPRKLFEYVERRVGLAPPAAADTDRLAEAKATRDVLVHNRGVADAEYRKKAGPLARFAAGERIDVPQPYHQEVWELIRKVVTDLADGAVAKVPA